VTLRDEDRKLAEDTLDEYERLAWTVGEGNSPANVSLLAEFRKELLEALLSVHELDALRLGVGKGKA
jgi:hypothetical protein